jgi:uncharacterized membrane protein
VPTSAKGTAFRIVSLSYLALVLLQPVWHLILPPPYGARLVWLAVLATVPLLLPLKGVMQGSLRSMTWAGYLVMLYLLIGVTEAWSNPPQRGPALLQVLLVILYVISLLKFSRPAEGVPPQAPED